MFRTVCTMIESGDMIESPRPQAPDDGPESASGPAPGAPAGSGADPSAPLPPPDAVHHRIWRSPDRVLTGAAGGLAAALGVDAVWTRMAFVVLTLFRGVGVWMYVIASLLLPAGPFARPLSLRRRVLAGAAGVGLVLVLWDGLETPYGNRFAVPYGPIGLIGSPSGLVFLLAGAAVVLWRRDQPRAPRPLAGPPTSNAWAAWAAPPPGSGVTDGRTAAAGDGSIPGSGSVAGSAGSEAGSARPAGSEAGSEAGSARPARPARVRRPASIVGRLAFSVALAVVAVVAAVSGGSAHAMQIGLGLAAAVCGLGLVAGSTGQRARWLVVPAALALAGSVVASANAFAGTRLGLTDGNSQYGSMVGGRSNIAVLPPVIDRGAGDTQVYLVDLAASRSLTMRIGNGNIDLWVPSDRDIGVEGTYRVGVGSIELDSGPILRGYHRSVAWFSGKPNAAIILKLDAAVGIGRLTIHRYSIVDVTHGVPPGNGGDQATTTVFETVPVPPASTAVLPPGAIGVNPDGTVVYADGRIGEPDGTIRYPDGSMIAPSGNVSLTDGTELHPDGGRVYGAGAQVLADGTVLLTNGARILPDGTVVLGGEGNSPGGTIPPRRPPVAPATTVGPRTPPLTAAPPGTTSPAPGAPPVGTTTLAPATTTTIGA